MQRIYLDYAAGTPVEPRVLKFMQPYFAAEAGNPGSLHSFGQKAMAAADEAREKVARALGADFREIIFTSSATEANNLALRGVVKEYRTKNLERNRGNNSPSSEFQVLRSHPRVIVSSIEHESVLETARDLARDGADVIYLPVDKNGVVSLSALRSALTPETVLVSIMHVNNETGAVQPIQEISKLISEFRIQNLESRKKERASRFSILDSSFYPLLHTDAAQAFYLLDCRPEALGVDLMTLSAHKICGPKGAGALYCRQEYRTQNLEHGAKTPNVRPLNSKFHVLSSILTGGGQEFGLRSGTENVPALAGFGRAAELAVKERAANYEHISRMRGDFLAGLKKIFPKFRLNGEADSAPHILNIYLPGHPAEEVLTRLDLAGVAASSGSACRARAAEPSYVLRAMGLPARRVRESIRVSLGRPTTPAEIAAALRIFRSVLLNETK